MAKVLVAEDSEINQKLIAHLLRRLGVEYCIVDNGEKAVHEALRDRYAIVFMDVVMPVKNGLDASREILASLPAASRPTIVALTANVEEADQEACKNAGMQDFLKKPMQLDDVKRIIDKFIPVA